LDNINKMSGDPNSDAVDILSELENDDKNIKDESNERVVVDSDKNLQSESSSVETSNTVSMNENELKSKSDEKIRNVIFVGNKTIMTYVNSTLTQLSATPVVTIKARGKRITQAVDISQFIMKRMNSVGYKISDVRISSESLTSQDGRKRNVSLLAIDISNTNI